MSSFDDFTPLVKHERNYTHMDNLATISAGYKREDGVPVVSRDGTIYVSDPEGRAPGLAKILADNGKKHLTIAVPSNEWRDIIQQTFRKESRNTLQAFGDAESITELIPVNDDKSPARRVVHKAGTPGYEQLKAECKVTTSITFILADYAPDGSIVYLFPDGVGTYRLRTTSEHTAENLIGCLKLIAQLNHGHVAGIPISTRIAYPQKTTPNATKAKVPVFVFGVKQPPGMMLTSKVLPQLAAGAAEAIGLSLPALPPGETIDDAIEEISATKLNALTTGVNPDKVRATFFAILGDDEAERRAFLRQYTANVGPETIDSLAKFLETATPESASEMLEALEAYVEANGLGGVVHEVEAELVTDDEPARSTEDQRNELWSVLVAGYGAEQAKVILKDWLTELKLTASADLTAAQVERAIAHYRAHAQTQAA
jgi:hypothetical protein